MDATRQANLNEDIESWAVGWQIRGIRVDNPSGKWLHIPNVDIYVPPYTLGWQRGFSVGLANISIRFAATSPTGSPSENLGGPILVRIFDELVGDSQGAASGALQSQNPFGAGLTLATLTLATANEAGTTTTLVTPAAGNRIIPVSFVASMLASGGPTPEIYFGVISIRVVDGLGNTLLPLMAISPEMPESTKDFPSGTKLAVGDVLRVRGQTFAGGGRTDFGASVLYYEQVG